MVRKHLKADRLQLMTNGRIEASFLGGGQQQRLLAHLPLVFHPDPKNVAVVRRRR